MILLFPEPDRPAYTTVQTMVYRLEAKKAVRRVKKISNSHIFEAAVSRNASERRLVRDLLSLFGGRMQPLMAHLVESGKLTLDDDSGSRHAGHRKKAVLNYDLPGGFLCPSAGTCSTAGCSIQPLPI